VIAAEIVEDLRAALEEFELILGICESTLCLLDKEQVIREMTGVYSRVCLRTATTVRMGITPGPSRSRSEGHESCH
jgi:hypothetical protein